MRSWLNSLKMKWLLYKRKQFIEMLPRIKKYGIRYYFDSKFRKRMKCREGNKRYGSGFKARTNTTKRNLIGRDGAHCRICKHYFSEKELTIDHVIPIREGGTNQYKNLQLLCRPCHNYKDFGKY